MSVDNWNACPYCLQRRIRARQDHTTLPADEVQS